MRRLSLPALLVAATALAGCSGEEGQPPDTVDDPEGLLTVVAPPVMRGAIEDLDAAWTAEGNDSLRVDLGPADLNQANNLTAALGAAAPRQVASDVVLTDNPRTVDSADASLWTDAGLVATTELRAVLPAAAAEADGQKGADVLAGAHVAVCGDYCGELAQDWLQTVGGDADATLLPLPEEAADGRGQVVAEDYAELPAWSGRLAVSAVVEGEAELALTYLADVADDGVTTVALPDAPAVGLTALVSEGRDTEEATAFVEFLQSGAGREILRDHGFTAP